MFDVNAAHTLARWQHQENQLRQQHTTERPWGMPGRTSTDLEFEDLDRWARQASEKTSGVRRGVSGARVRSHRRGQGSLHAVIAQLKQRAAAH
ncbi:hypothetical protein ACSDQ9_09335 [Aestuariimicrobium soli]|uniref:hypothetical protein n=1 Tax=Aestuariimicrobium soli TaxID=2035834 RepID=UPI003EC062DF